MLRLRRRSGDIGIDNSGEHLTINVNRRAVLARLMHPAGAVIHRRDIAEYIEPDILAGVRRDLNHIAALTPAAVSEIRADEIPDHVGRQVRDRLGLIR